MMKENNTNTTSTADKIVLVSEYSSEEAAFMKKKADSKGMNLEDWQKYTSLNPGNKRYKDKKINAELVKLCEAVKKTEEDLKDKKIKETINDLNTIKSLLGETQCLL